MKDPYVLKNEMLASRYDEFKENGYAGLIKTNDEIVKEIRIFECSEYNIFFGYYDLPQIRKDEKKMLIMKVKKDASTSHDVASVYYINLDDDSWHFVTNTRAWCWQQGCRLQWLPGSSK